MQEIIAEEEPGKSYSAKRKLTATHDTIKDFDPEARTIMDLMEDTVPQTILFINIIFKRDGRNPISYQTIVRYS